MREISGAGGAEAGGDGVVELNKNDEGDAEIGAEHAEERAESVEGLRDDDTAAHGGGKFGWDVVLEEACAKGITPTGVDDRADQEDVEPVDEQRRPIADEHGEEFSGERQERYRGQERDMNPREIAVRAREVSELRFLANPEDAEGDEAHEIREQARREEEDGVPEIAFSVDGFGGGDAEVENEQSHRKGENSVAESGETLDASSRVAIVIGHGGPV